MAKLYSVVQEGGTSQEQFASSYNSREDAEEAIDCHADAGYTSIGPIEVEIIEDDPTAVEHVTVRERDLLEAIETALRLAV